MFVSLQIWPLFASKIIVSHICEELLSFNKEKKVCKNRIRFRPELLLSWPKKKEKSFEFLDLNKRWSTGHIFAVPTKKLMRAKKFYFSCFVCRNTFRKLQTYWVKNQFVVHKFQFGTKIEKVWKFWYLRNVWNIWIFAPKIVLKNPWICNQNGKIRVFRVFLARKFKYFISSRLFLARKFKLPYR